jgi:uncharacterized protein
VVTWPDLHGRSASDLAVTIGREWGVGAKGESGDPAKNLGVVILLVPRRDHRPGTGDLFIATGRGAEGFLPDSRIGRIRDAMGSFLAREDYGAGLAAGVDLVAQAFAEEYGVTLTGTPVPTEGERGPAGATVFKLLLLLIVLFLISRRRGGFLPLMLGGFGGGRRGGGWGGCGGGGFGGGFGGFGGGGGFSGGGAEEVLTMAHLTAESVCGRRLGGAGARLGGAAAVRLRRSRDARCRAFGHEHVARVRRGG